MSDASDIDEHALEMDRFIETREDSDTNDSEINDIQLYDSHEPSDELVSLLKEREQLNSGIWSIFFLMLLGIIFGFCFNKSRVFEPDSIVDQMLFKRFIMLKFFLSAAGSSVLTIANASWMFPQRFSIARSKYESVVLFIRVLGGFIIGIGMSVSGSCPGTAVAQFGAGVPNSWFTLIGLFTGAFIFGITEPIWSKCSSTHSTENSYIFIDKYFVNINYKLIAIIFGIFAFIIVFLLEFFWPWTSELTIQNDINCINNTLGILSCGSWPPWICGFLVGILQIGLIVVFGNTIGTSSSYVCIMAQWMRLCPQCIDTFTHFSSQLNRYWQPFFLFYAALGSWLGVILTEQNIDSMNVWKYPFDDIKGNNELRSFFGGILLLIGSRMATGCPSGHGFSGYGLLSILSIIFVIPAMFGGGIVTAFIFYNY